MIFRERFVSCGTVWYYVLRLHGQTGMAAADAAILQPRRSTVYSSEDESPGFPGLSRSG
jgi:hypothetical protein